jgi:hypothetical protein
MKIKNAYLALAMLLNFSTTVSAEVTGGYPFVTSATHFRLQQGNRCWGYVEGEKDCGGVYFVNDSFSMNTLNYGRSGQIKTASNNPEFPAYGYAHAFFLKNPTGQPKPLDITIGSCNDVIMYTVTGRVKSGTLGETANLVYHRSPPTADGSNVDGGKGCPCASLKPSNITLPTGDFRLVVITRGSDCSSYLAFPEDANNTPVNWINRHYLQIDRTNLNLFLK